MGNYHFRKKIMKMRRKVVAMDGTKTVYNLV